VVDIPAGRERTRRGRAGAQRAGAPFDAQQPVGRPQHARGGAGVPAPAAAALDAISAAESLTMRPGPRPTVGAEVLDALRTAIARRRQVILHYRARSTGTLSRQPVQPYGLLYGHRHYLVAYSLNEEVLDYRSYALPGIERVELTDHPFTPDPAFSLQTFAQQSFGVFQEAPVNVVWRFKPEAAAEAQTWHFHPTQRMEPQPDGPLIVRFTAGGLLEMCWHLFTWADAVEIVRPVRLKRQYAELLRGALAVADPPSDSRP